MPANRDSWQVLFRHALEIIDAAAPKAGGALDHWTFGGGTALMLTHRQRVSRDVDLFFADPQSLGFLTPRLNDVAESKTGAYDEQANYLKLNFNQGQVDYIVSPALTTEPFREQEVLGRMIKVETDAEILAKKLWYRGDTLKSRDVLDIACVLERSPALSATLHPFFDRHREALAARLVRHDALLRDEFQRLDRWEYERTYDECLVAMRTAFGMP